MEAQGCGGPFSFRTEGQATRTPTMDSSQKQISNHFLPNAYASKMLIRVRITLIEWLTRSMSKIDS